MAKSSFGLRLGIAYVFDWIVIIALAAGGAVLNYINGFHRPFAITDPALAYPVKDDIVSITAAGLIAFVAPAVIIIIISLGFSPQPFPRSTAKSAVWRRKIWDTNAGLLGLALSCAATLFVVSGLKDMVGKPRPDLLARCDPDVARINQYIVGGFGTSLDSEAEALVVSGICRQTDHRFLDDGFASFPSGHSSFSWAGLLYLTLFLCCRFSIGIPYLAPSAPTWESRSNLSPEDTAASLRTSGAAPPVWLMVLAFIPCGVALFICSSRYADFHHEGFDIIAGAAIGILFAWASFRAYHMPLRRGMGTAWAPRKADHAFTSGHNAQGPVTALRPHGVRLESSMTGGANDLETGIPMRGDTRGSDVEMFTYSEHRSRHS